VALPAFELARADFEAGLISESQQAKARAAIQELFDTIAGDPTRPHRRGRRRPPSALDSGRIGLGLRQARLQASGGAGPEHAPRGSVTLCLSSGSIGRNWWPSCWCACCATRAWTRATSRWTNA
jgi:hypothetical protein